MIDLLVSKDKKAFEYLYDNYSSTLNGVIFKIVRSEELAQEILQDTFLRVWDKIKDYDSSKGRLFTWMVNIARNLSIDKTRSKEFKVASKSDDLDSNVYVSDVYYSEKNNPEHIGIKSLLDQLMPEQKKVIDLMYFQGYSQSEISEEFDIPLGTVKTRVRAAIGKLRNLV